MASPAAPSFSSLPTSQPPVLDPHSLPSSQSADLKLEPATFLEYVQTAYLNADEWRGPLTMHQYLQREDALQAVEFTRNGRITGWILTSDNLPKNADGSRVILASCESILKHAYLARDGTLHKIQAHGIASVYNRPEHRGKGYASRMMAELGKKLESWQSVDGQTNHFSVLFSDIGTTFYARHGWKVYPSTHIHLHPVSRDFYAASCSGLPAVRDLSLEDLKHIPTVDYMEHRLRETSRSNPKSVHLAIRPDFEHFEWHFVRDELQTKILGKDYPEVKGAMHQATGLGLTWCRVYASKKSDWQLHVLHIIVPPSVGNSEEATDVMAALLLRAQLEAQEWDMAAGVEVSKLSIQDGETRRLDFHMPRR
jgi:GNAT superfamily N-acetyltransferase